MRLKLHGLSDVGLGKQVNEDSFSACADLSAEVWGSGFEETKLNELGAMVLISDGIGPKGAGAEASDIFIAEFKEFLKDLNAWPSSDSAKLEMLKDGLEHCHEAIREKAESDHKYKGLGASGLVAWIHEKKLYLSWVGDSRAYLLRNQGELIRLTDDHTIAWNLFKKGEISEEQARKHPQANALTQCLGDTSTSPEPDALIFDLSKGDRLLVCTDGLIKELSPKQLLDAVVHAEDPSACCLNLIKAASKGSEDNLTVVVTDITEGPLANVATNTTDRPASMRKEKMINPLIFIGIILLASGAIWYILPKGQAFSPAEAGALDSINIDISADTAEMSKKVVELPENSNVDSLPADSLLLDSATEARISAFKELESALDREINKLEDEGLMQRVNLQLNNPEGKDPFLVEKLAQLKENINTLISDLETEASPVKGEAATALNNFKIRLASLQSSTTEAQSIVEILEENTLNP